MNGKLKLVNPYPGIRSYEPEEQHLFFGREKVVSDLITRLSVTGFLSVIGASGSGKSSLIRAGLIPSFNKNDKKNDTELKDSASQGWRFAIFNPGDNPLQNLASTMDDLIRQEKLNLNHKDNLKELFANDKNALAGLIEEMNNISGKRTCIFVDQFEEVFRFKTNNDENAKYETEIFISLLLEASNQKDKGIYSIMTMRSDFLDDCTDYRDLFEAINKGYYLVPKMTEDELRNAITGPIITSGMQISDNLVNRLLNDFGEQSDQLPILQHSLMRMWDNWQLEHKEDPVLDIVHYEHIGTMEKAISIHAEEIYNELKDDKSRQITEKMFKALTDLSKENRGTRRPTKLSEICTLSGALEEEVITIIEKFRANGCGFLLPSPKHKLNRDSIIDISHESIMKLWERLSKWVDEETKSAQLYLRLSKSAELYQEGKTGLWVNPDLQLALQWQTETKPNATWAMRYDMSFERAISFLNYSKREFELESTRRETRQKKELKRAKRTAIILGSASVVSLLLLVVSLILLFMSGASEKKALENVKIAVSERKSADEERRKAVIFTKISEQQQQIALQQKYITEEQKKIALSQREIAEKEKDKAEGERVRAEKARDEATKQRQLAEEQRKRAEENRELAELEKEKAEKERQKAEISERNTKRLRLIAIARNVAIQSQKLYGTVKGDLPSLLALQSFLFNKNNAGFENNPDVYNALSMISDDKPKLRKHIDAIRGISIPVTGKIMATCSDDGTVKIWDLNFTKSEPRDLNTMGYGKKGFRSVAFSPDGQMLISGSVNGTILMWNVMEKDPKPIIFVGHKSVVNKLLFSPDGKKFISSSSDKTFRMWSVGNNSTSTIIEQGTGKILALAYCPDNRYIVCGGDDGSIKLYDPKNITAKPTIVEPGGKPIHSLMFNKNGTLLAVGSSTGLVRIWNVRTLNSRPIELIGHISAVTDISFNPKNNTVATGSYDGTIRIWSYDNPQQQPLVISGFDSWIYSLAFTPEGDKIICSGSDRYIRMFTTDIESLAEKICKKVSRNLTTEEWDKYIGSDISYEKTCANLP